MIQVREVLRRWLRDDGGERSIAERAGVDRKTARRYIEVATKLGLDRCGGEVLGHAELRCAFGKLRMTEPRRRSLGMFRTTITGFRRETLLVPGPHDLAASQFYEWRSWYSREESWLEWGLEQLGIPPITGLLDLLSSP